MQSCNVAPHHSPLFILRRCDEGSGRRCSVIVIQAGILDALILSQCVKTRLLSVMSAHAVSSRFQRAQVLAWARRIVKTSFTRLFSVVLGSNAISLRLN